MKIDFKITPISKVFALLIISTIVIHLIGWALEWKYGKLFFPLSEKTVLYSDLFSPGLDAGYFEHYQYILILWCVILSTIWIFSKRLWGAISIPIIYLFLFLDDSLQLHDRFYASDQILFLGKFITLEKFIRLKDFAELFYWSLVFLIVIIISLPAIIKDNVEIQGFIIKNYALFFIMAFFGIFIDLIAANFDKWIIINNNEIIFFKNISMLLFEEVGEIGTIALACIWLFNLNVQNK